MHCKDRVLLTFSGPMESLPLDGLCRFKFFTGEDVLCIHKNKSVECVDRKKQIFLSKLRFENTRIRSVNRKDEYNELQEIV